LRIAITGATGLLGRNLLFETIKQNLKDIGNIEIFLLGRQIGCVDIHTRLLRILTSDGMDYLDVDKDKKEEILSCFGKNIKAIRMDLNKDNLLLTREDFKLLRSKPIDFFFHIAALTDFRDSPTIIKALSTTNVQGTSQILKLVDNLKVKEFSYVGSAYSCGRSKGNVRPNYIDFDQSFRNPYEITKLKAELLVKEFDQKHQTKCRYFRPSTICGRLMEKEIGSVCKFDVFYAWAAFFTRIKYKQLRSFEHLYTTPLTVNLKVCLNPKSGLNIVPADYCAKLMYLICTENISGRSYHLVNNSETPHSFYISSILDYLNIHGVTYVEEIPNAIENIEKIYYKTVGKIFTPYVVSDPMLFNTHNIKELAKKHNLVCPDINKKNFMLLLKYAKKYNFGLKEN